MKMKYSLVALAAMTLGAEAALTSAFLNLQTNPAGGNANPEGWTQTSTGSSALAAAAIRDAGQNAANWTGHMLYDMANANQTGRISTELTGTAEAGTYTFTLTDVGYASFGTTGDGELRIGFAETATGSLLAGFTAIEGGVDVTTGANVGLGNGVDFQTSYTASGSETGLFLVIERVAGHTGRDIMSSDAATLSFTAVPEPSSTALLGLGGLALIMRRRK